MLRQHELELGSEEPTGVVLLETEVPQEPKEAPATLYYDSSATGDEQTHTRQPVGSRDVSRNYRLIWPMLGG